MKCPILAIVVGSALAAGTALANLTTVPDFTIIKQKLETMEQALPQTPPGVRDFEEVRGGIRSWEEITLARRQQLLDALEDLELRARNRSLDVMELRRMRQRVIDAKADAYIDQLIIEAREQKMSRAKFQYIVDLVEERAALAQPPPQVREKYDECVAMLRKRYQDAQPVKPTEIALLGDEIVRMSLDRAIDHLEKMAKERKATREQFNHVVALLERRAELWQEDRDFRSHVAFMKQRISNLMDRAMQCDLQPEEIRALHEGLMQRARASMQ